jgi:hypothetical protein
MNMDLEILITQDDLESGLLLGKSDLGGVVPTIRDAISRSSTQQTDKEIIRGGLETFIGSYYALSSKLENLGIFSNEEKRMNIIWNYSLSCASTAFLSVLEKRSGEKLTFPASVASGISPIEPNSLEGLTQFSVMTNTLRDYQGFLTNSKTRSLFQTGLFLALLERKSAEHAAYSCRKNESLGELTRLSPLTTSADLSFKHNKQRLNGQNKPKSKAATLTEDELPKTLPKYAMNNVRLEQVVGNKEPIAEILDYVTAMMHYHAPSKQNYLWMEGNGFPEAVLLIGDPGVGKTYLTNAIMNAAGALAKKHQYPLELVELNGKEIGSTYQNKSGMILEEYLSMMRKGDRAYLVMMDEFDDLIPMGRGGKLRGDARQRMNAFKRQTGNSTSLGNIFFIGITNYVSSEEDIPKPVLDRFTPIIIHGPQTPKEYGDILKLGFQRKDRLGLVDSSINWEKIGGYMMDWKKRLDRYNSSEAAIGRGYKNITTQLASQSKQRQHLYANDVIGKDPGYHAQFYKKEFLPITARSLYAAIDNGLQRLADAAQRGKVR